MSLSLKTPAKGSPRLETTHPVETLVIDGRGNVACTIGNSGLVPEAGYATAIVNAKNEVICANGYRRPALWQRQYNRDRNRRPYHLG